MYLSISLPLSIISLFHSLNSSAFVYPGDLPTDAFFWNNRGVIGSMNGLYPVTSLYGGLGRNFISRHLVGSQDLDDAVKRCTQPNQATGHSYNLASTKEQRLLNVEVAPGVDTPNKQSLYVVTPITSKVSDSLSPLSLCLGAGLSLI